MTPCIGSSTVTDTVGHHCGNCCATCLRNVYVISTFVIGSGLAIVKTCLVRFRENILKSQSTARKHSLSEFQHGSIVSKLKGV